MRPLTYLALDVCMRRLSLAAFSLVPRPSVENKLVIQKGPDIRLMVLVGAVFVRVLGQHWYCLKRHAADVGAVYLCQVYVQYIGDTQLYSYVCVSIDSVVMHRTVMQ